MREIGLHEMVGTAVNLTSVYCLSHATAGTGSRFGSAHGPGSQAAAHGMGGAHGETDKAAPTRRSCDISATASRDPHHIPGSASWIRTVPTTSSRRRRTTRLPRLGSRVVDRVAIVVCKDALLDAEHLPPQRGGLAALPGFGREFDAIFGRQEHGEWIEDHATSASALIGRQRRAGAALAATGLDVARARARRRAASRERPQDLVHECGRGARWLSSGVPEIGTNGTTNG